ncbi:MAG: TonB-dependent receptor [Acidobacteriota bacterium]
MRFSSKGKGILRPLLLMLAAVSSGTLFISSAQAATVATSSNLGIIRGVVRDEGGSPISDATVAIFRSGTSRLLKQVQSSRDGSFLAKILPGTYKVLAIAQGFNPVVLSSVEVSRADDLVYGFNLARAGNGNTLPEKRIDRNSSVWAIRAAAAQRSIYQNSAGKAPIDEDAVADTANDNADRPKTTRRGQTVVETYFASSNAGNYQGTNFATILPSMGSVQVILAGQTGIGKAAPQRLETDLKIRANDKHQFRVNASAGRLGTVQRGLNSSELGQFSIQGLDEWKIREGVIVVFGFDYSKFLGAGSDHSLSPRLGVQLDVDEKTRFRAAYTTRTEEKSWADAVSLEDSQIAFTEPIAVEDLVIEKDKPQMNRSSRVEFGVERILDNRSSIEANAFFDTTFGRGVGLNNIPLDVLSSDNFSDFVSNQTGNTQGVRLVYTRRLNGSFTTSAGYSFGKGQKISDAAVSNPSNIFENAFFQSFFGQFEADLKSGTSVKTIFRLSPQATVFAIDPFQGRLAIYDPSLSILITQNLPTLGLPIHAEAIVDARNLFGFQTGVNGEDGALRVTSQGRMLRGGVLVRF